MDTCATSRRRRRRFNNVNTVTDLLASVKQVLRYTGTVYNIIVVARTAVGEVYRAKTISIYLFRRYIMCVIIFMSFALSKVYINTSAADPFNDQNSGDRDGRRPRSFSHTISHRNGGLILVLLLLLYNVIIYSTKSEKPPHSIIYCVLN